MNEFLSALLQRKQLSARAIYVGERIDLRTLSSTESLASAPLAIKTGSIGCAVLFRYGVVVFIDVDPMEQTTFLKQLDEMVAGAFAEAETESASIVVNTKEDREGIFNNNIVLYRFSIKHLQVIADILAKSVVLAHYEAQVAKAFDSIEPLARSLKQGATRPAKELLQHIGQTLLIHHNMVGRVEVREKPELLWEFPEAERLYLRLEDEYELPERHTALERKLQLISMTVETLLDLLHAKRSLRVEWYIVILIVVEIILTLYDMFIRNTH